MELLNARGLIMLLQAEQDWRVGGGGVNGEQDSELTTVDTPRDEVKCLV